MAISTYSELKTAIQSWSQRGSAISSVVADFVTLSESQIRRDVRCRAMVQTATGTLSGATLALPTRFIEAISVTLSDTRLDYVDPASFDQIPDETHSYYTIRGDNFEFGSTTGDYSISYYQSFAALSGASDTNWLLTNYPDIYLFSGIAEAAIWLRDDPIIWQQRYLVSVAKLHNTERKASTAPAVRVNPIYVV